MIRNKTLVRSLKEFIVLYAGQVQSDETLRIAWTAVNGAIGLTVGLLKISPYTLVETCLSVFVDHLPETVSKGAIQKLIEDQTRASTLARLESLGKSPDVHEEALQDLTVSESLKTGEGRLEGPISQEDLKELEKEEGS